MNNENYISEEAFEELVNGLEFIESFTLYGRKSLKHHIKKLQEENQQLKESNLYRYLPNIVGLICSGGIPKEVYNKYFGNIPCGFMNEKELTKWFLERSDDNE